MRTQISRAILAVAVLIVIGLGLPLAVVVQRFYQDGALARLQRRAAETIVEISLPFDPHDLARVAAEPDAPGSFSVYDAHARRVFGSAPARAENTVRRALTGTATSSSDEHELTLAVPITDASTEDIIGALVVSQPASVVDGEVQRAWLVMGVAVAVALGGATALARAQSRHLAAPVARLAEQAIDLGRGDFTARVPTSGIAEVDTVAAALNETAGQLAELLARERAFSADVSHQLRTPLTGLRLRLERAAEEGGGLNEQLAGALGEVGRLEATVEHLLALSRDRHPLGTPLAVDDVVAATAERWHEPFRAAGRELRTEGRHRGLPVHGSSVSMGQVLDVLVDNGLRHGAGTVTVRCRTTAGALVIDVEDEGQGIADDRRAAVFERHEGHGHGIGLALARSITEAEGGRLLLATGQPPCFQVVLPTIGYTSSIDSL